MDSSDLAFTIVAVAIISAVAAVRIARIVTNNWTTEDDERCGCDLQRTEQK